MVENLPQSGYGMPNINFCWFPVVFVCFCLFWGYSLIDNIIPFYKSFFISSFWMVTIVLCCFIYQFVSTTLPVCWQVFIGFDFINPIWSFTPDGVCKTLICSLVTSCSDTGSVLLYSMLTSFFSIQEFQNKVTRIINRRNIFDHFTPVSVNLHRLHTEQQIQYKINLQLFEALNEKSSLYLQTFIQVWILCRSLESLQVIALVVEFDQPSPLLSFYVSRSTNSFRSFSLQWMNILKWN